MVTLPVLDILPWAISAQGVILAILSFRTRRHVSNRYLGAFLLLLSFHALVALAWAGPAAVRVPELIILFTCFPFFYGPLVYRYVWHSLFRTLPERVPFLVHAIPAALNLLLYLFFYVVAGRAAFAAVTAAVFVGDAPPFVLVVEWAKVFSGFFYTARIVRLVRNNIDGLREWASPGPRRRWIYGLVGSFLINWIIVLISAALLWSVHVSTDLRLALTGIQLLAFLAFLYVVTFFALRYPAVLDPREVRAAIRERLNLPPGFVDETLRRLERFREERGYTDPDVTLPTLAERLGVHPNALSFIINEELGVGFREYLNTLRVEEFVRRADDSTTSTLRLAFDVGFSSKSTFLRAFRERFGTTPAQYLAQRS